MVVCSKSAQNYGKNSLFFGKNKAISGADGRIAKSKFRIAKNAVCSDHLFLEKDIRKKPAIGLITGFFGGGG